MDLPPIPPRRAPRAPRALPQLARAFSAPLARRAPLAEAGGAGDEARALAALTEGLALVGAALAALAEGGSRDAVLDAADAVVARLALYEVVSAGDLRACAIVRESGLVATGHGGVEKEARAALAELCAGIPAHSPPPPPFRAFYAAALERARAGAVDRARRAHERALAALAALATRAGEVTGALVGEVTGESAARAGESAGGAAELRELAAAARELEQQITARGHAAVTEWPRLRAAEEAARAAPGWKRCEFFAARLAAALAAPRFETWAAAGRAAHLARVADAAAQDAAL